MYIYVPSLASLVMSVINMSYDNGVQSKVSFEELLSIQIHRSTGCYKIIRPKVTSIALAAITKAYVCAEQKQHIQASAPVGQIERNNSYLTNYISNRHTTSRILPVTIIRRLSKAFKVYPLVIVLGLFHPVCQGI